MRPRFPLVALLGAGVALLVGLPSIADDAPSKQRIDHLIDQLGSGTFAEREKATKELATIGLPALEGLRKAAKSEDVEVRKRAEELLPRIQIQADSVQQLKPRRIHLTYKDVPLNEALADFRKKSGYTISLFDPDNKLKDRKIALDTGETTFWRALAQFCEKAGVVEASLDDLLPAPRRANVAPQPLPARRGAPMQPAGVVRPIRAALPINGGQIYLKDGKSEKRPTDDRGAIRVRVLEKSAQFREAGAGESLLPLEVTAEPKLQVESLESPRILKAVDDRDQPLIQFEPQVEVPAVNAGAAPPGAVVVGRPMMGMVAGLRMGIHQQTPLYLKKSGKEARSLKELKGTIAAHVLAEPQPFISVDDLSKAKGKRFKCKEGGFIEVLDMNQNDEGTTLRFDFEPPPSDKIRSAQGAPIQAAAFRVNPQIAPGNLPPPPPPRPGEAVPQANPIPMPALAPAVRSYVGPMNGLCVQDDKGNKLPFEMGIVEPSRTNGRVGLGPVMTYTFTCPHGKERGKPAKLVYLGSEHVTIEIPFAFQDVLLP